MNALLQHNISEASGNPTIHTCPLIANWCGKPGPLAKKIAVTFFNNQYASEVYPRRASMLELAEKLCTIVKPSKEHLPHIKLGRFGALKSKRGSYKTKDNQKDISGVETEYDGGIVSPHEAAEKLAAAGVAALIYTSPSHGLPEKGHRWRVLCPCRSQLLAVEMRRGLVARVNGVLGGILAGESFTDSQGFTFGAVEGQAEPETWLVEGRFLDDCADLAAGAIDKARKAPREIGEPVPAVDQSGDPILCARAARRLAKLAEGVAATEAGGTDDGKNRNMVLNEAAYEAGGYVACGTLAVEAATELLYEAACENGYEGQYGDAERVIRAGLESGMKRPLPLPERVNADGFDDDAEPAEDARPEGEARKTDGLTFLKPSECEALAAQPYVIKGLLAEGNVGCIVGDPGSAKSLLGPHLGYTVAQGREAFGMRTRQGGVLYVAAENPRGMCGRVAALRCEHGEADDFKLVSGISDLLSNKSAELKALRKAIEEHRPRLVIIDTVKAAFPSVDEITEMGRVVAAARELARLGPAVLLIHHPAKGGSTIARGHGSLNADLDVSLHLTRGDDRIVRGRLTKNRNGPCDLDIAFRIREAEFGQDEDGDPITAAWAKELPAGDGKKRPKLSRPQRALMKIIHRRLKGGLEADEAAVRDEAIGGCAVSGSEDRDNRRRAVSRVIRELSSAGLISVRGDRIRLLGTPADQFEDEKLSDDQPEE